MDNSLTHSLDPNDKAGYISCYDPNANAVVSSESQAQAMQQGNGNGSEGEVVEEKKYLWSSVPCGMRPIYFATILIILAIVVVEATGYRTGRR